MNYQIANELFNNYINGNRQDFIKGVRKLNRTDLLTCIDYLINEYGYTYDDKSIVTIFLMAFLSY